MLTVSVLIPSYNRPEATTRAVRSALAQSYSVKEVVIVDDASDPALDACALEALDPRVRVHRLQRNGGAAAARQAAVALASGDVIAFLDSDDVWTHDKLAFQIPVLEQANDELLAVGCGWEETDEAGRVFRRRTPVPARRAGDFARGCWFSPGSTVVMRRQSFWRVGPFDTSLRRLEDLDWFCRFGIEGGRLAIVPRIGVRVHVGRHARLQPVEAAAEAILAKNIWRSHHPRADVRALAAYLHVERARAALNERRIVQSAISLLHSLLLHPRSSIHLRNWWMSERVHA